MILIGDGGSTKADWWYLRQGKAENIKTIGFNPLFHTTDSVIDGLNQSKELKQIAPEITEVYFFGASCSSETRNAIIENGLSIFFSNAKNYVDHDLMGAALATSKGEKGIICILGTGSNAAYFDGNDFPNRVPALGYILGDEGSGAYIGKKVMADFLYGLLPGELNKHFSEELKLNKDLIFNHVYQQSHANIYLASFAKELALFKELDYVNEIVLHSFNEFLKYHILCYPQSKNNKVHFVGSVAFHFKEILLKCLKDLSLELGEIIAEPGKEILNYYLNRKTK